MPLITTTEKLSEFCRAQKSTPYITVDTEFMRERTYWPKLCLVQVAGPDQSVAIDPLADGMSLSPLYELLNDPSILKVFHAARQDVEIFHNLTGQVPTPMVDTQVAAMVCGFGEAVSYETLVMECASVRIDKSSRFTDWSHRPLTDRQIQYALGDVIHLRTVFEVLTKKLIDNGRQEWVREEMAVLTNPSTYLINPDEVWRRFKWRSDKPRSRALLQSLAAWREREAQRQNVPRNRVIRDEALMEIAHNPPKSIHDLSRIRGLSHGFAEGRYADDLLKLIDRTMVLPLDECPKEERKRSLPNGATAVMDLLKVLLKQVSEEHGVASKLIATTEELEELAMNDQATIHALTGWRRTLFGELALALKNGDLSLRIKNNRVITDRLS